MKNNYIFQMKILVRKVYFLQIFLHLYMYIYFYKLYN